MDKVPFFAPPDEGAREGISIFCYVRLHLRFLRLRKGYWILVLSLEQAQNSCLSVR